MSGYDSEHKAYELSKGEYRTIMDALEFAEENAVHEDSRSKFWAARQTLMQQFEDQDGES